MGTTVKKFTKLHRFLHWGIAGAISVSFVTGFLHEFWMKKKGMATIIEEGLSDTGITAEKAVEIAVSIREPMWQWHVYMAYILVVLFAVRMIYMIVDGKRFPNPLSKHTDWKEKIEGVTFILFYLFFAVNIVTGFYHMWGEVRELRGLSGTIHKWSVYWFPIFIIIHFVGIYIGEKTNRKGCSSKIIGGD